LSQTWSMLQLFTEREAPNDLHSHLPTSFTAYCLQTGCGVALGDTATTDCYRSGWRLTPEVYVTPLTSLYFHESLLGPIIAKSPSDLSPSPTGLQTSRPEPGLIWQDFEDEIGQGYRDGNEPGFAGGIGHRISLKDNNWFHDGPVQFQAGDTVIVGLWIKMKEDGVPLTELGWEEWHAGEKVTWHYLSLNNSIKRLVGDWALCEREEVVRDPKNQIKINVTRWKRWPPGATIDKLMVRRKGTDVYGFEGDKPVWMNNRHTEFWPAEIGDSLETGE
jgi:hypothetical protein